MNWLPNSGFGGDVYRKVPAQRRKEWLHGRSGKRIDLRSNISDCRVDAQDRGAQHPTNDQSITLTKRRTSQRCRPRGETIPEDFSPFATAPAETKFVIAEESNHHSYVC